MYRGVWISKLMKELILVKVKHVKIMVNNQSAIMLIEISAYLMRHVGTSKLIYVGMLVSVLRILYHIQMFLTMFSAIKWHFLYSSVPFLFVCVCVCVLFSPLGVQLEEIHSEQPRVPRVVGECKLLT